jgi:hypothetical protein
LQPICTFKDDRCIHLIGCNHSPRSEICIQSLSFQALGVWFTFIMISIRGFLLLLFLNLFALTHALPKKGASSSTSSTASSAKAPAAGRVSKATDGSTILDKTVQIK